MPRHYLMWTTTDHSILLSQTFFLCFLLLLLLEGKDVSMAHLMVQYCLSSHQLLWGCVTYKFWTLQTFWPEVGLYCTPCTTEIVRFVFVYGCVYYIQLFLIFLSAHKLRSDFISMIMCFLNDLKRIPSLSDPSDSVEQRTLKCLFPPSFGPLALLTFG